KQNVNMLNGVVMQSDLVFVNQNNTNTGLIVILRVGKLVVVINGSMVHPFIGMVIVLYQTKIVNNLLIVFLLVLLLSLAMLMIVYHVWLLVAKLILIFLMPNQKISMVVGLMMLYHLITLVMLPNNH